MNELEQKLRTIVNERETKLLPENLKKGITLLGVEGTFDIPREEYIREFLNEEEMMDAHYANNCKNGDICTIVEHIEESMGITECNGFMKVVIPTEIIAKKSALLARTLKFAGATASADNYMNFSGNMLGSELYINVCGKTTTETKTMSLTYNYSSDRYILNGPTEPIVINFGEPMYVTDTSDVLLKIVKPIQVSMFMKIPIRAYEYNKDLGFIPIGGSNPSDGQILRQYETIEDMQSATVNMDDLGMVIRHIGENVQAGTTFGNMAIFPNTVTLPEGMSLGMKEYSCSAVDGSWYFDITTDNKSASIAVFLPDEEVISIDYTSDDGKVFKRTDNNGEVVDLTMEFISSEDMWSDAISYFIQKYIKDVVEIYCFGTEGWELVLSSDLGGEEGSTPEPTELLQLNANEVMRKGLGAAGIVLSVSGLEFPVYLDNNSTIEIETSQEAIAEAFGITPDIIKAGETVLGISGTYTGE